MQGCNLQMNSQQNTKSSQSIGMIVNAKDPYKTSTS